jgi:hypothetical protein
MIKVLVGHNRWEAKSSLDWVGSDVCHKEERRGGMGFRKFEVFNQSLLAK